MKKILAILLSGLCTGAIALPVGNPNEAAFLCSGAICDAPLSCCYSIDSLSLRAGYYGDYVFNRYLETTSSHIQVETTNIHTNAAYLALNFMDRVDLFTTLGVSCIEIETNSIIFGPFVNPFYAEIVTKADFSWSVGARAILFECSNFIWGIEGQYFNFSPSNIKYIYDSVYVFNTDELNYDIKYYEWQVGTGVSWQIYSFLIPYAAVKVSRAKIDLNTISFSNGLGPTITVPPFQSKRYVGAALGLSLVGSDCVALTFEGRFFDENALYVNAQFRF